MLFKKKEIEATTGRCCLRGKGSEYEIIKNKPENKKKKK